MTCPTKLKPFSTPGSYEPGVVVLHVVHTTSRDREGAESVCIAAIIKKIALTLGRQIRQQRIDRPLAIQERDAQGGVVNRYRRGVVAQQRLPLHHVLVGGDDGVGVVVTGVLKYLIQLVVAIGVMVRVGVQSQHIINVAA